MTKYVYSFGGGKADGNESMKNLLGGKGANLAEMASLGIPVPPGFTLTTENCVHYYKNNNTWPTDLEAQVKEVDELRPNIMDLFETMTEITISDVMSRFRLTRPTAGRKLNVLVKKGLIQKKGKGRGSIYIKHPS